jgi:mgtE-like transporter
MAISRRATRLFRSLRAERRTLRQGLVALVLSTVAGFIAGLTLSGIGDTLQALPGLIILIPAAVGMRGTIFGAIGARLGTTNAAGTFEVSFRRDGVLYQNVYIAVVTTFASSLWLAVLAKIAASAFGEPSISIWSLVTISVVGGALGSVFILLVTVGCRFCRTADADDLDSVSTPMVTALGDMVTRPDLYLATFLVRNATVKTRSCLGRYCVVLTARSTPACAPTP